MKTQLLKKAILVAYLLSSMLMLQAKIKLPAILGDNMVLQQQSNVKLWGEAKSKSNVTIKTSWNNNVYTVASDEKGNWLANVDTPTAGGPYNIIISDGEEITLKNILIGEVWFCSGQSNMEMPVRGFNGQPVKSSYDAIIKANPETPIRMYTTDSDKGKWVRQFNKEPQTDCKGEWLENTPGNVANISAIGYFFARYIQSTLNVPVGIIVSSWGGSKVEAWMSRDAIEPFPEIDLSILENKDEVNNPTATPCVLYNAKIAPLINFAIKGFLWYQGESNRNDADLYGRLMHAFVKDLRSKWNVGDFPFYYVQIAPFNYEGKERTSAALLREVQEKNMKDIPNSGMVTTMDIGDSLLIHPADKEIVGNRFAYWALGQTYKKHNLGYAPPVYKSMEIASDTIFLSFENAEHGLCPLFADLKGFEIAGGDKVFYPAKANEKAGKIIVTCEKINNPVAVRYCYKNYAEASVFNVYGIPASPFRTDNW
ncbi:MAG: sialate O-acetylesterase [Tannerellaceae bacterium]|jgi:sialate O-acetylesterase|nr:sialate O-acetylesterase [Tannerellaceae bacterium]